MGSLIWRGTEFIGRGWYIQEAKEFTGAERGASRSHEGLQWDHIH